MHRLLQVGLCASLPLLLCLIPFFLVVPLTHRTCGNSADALGCITDGQWIFESSSKQRTFDDIDDESQQWRTCFRTNAAQIHAEFLAFERNHSYKGLLGDYSGDVSRDPSHVSWHQIPLQLWSSESAEVEAFFPSLTNCLHSSPLTSLIFSILDPWSSIRPHTGSSHTILRYQLNLELPQYDPVTDLQHPKYGASECTQETWYVKGELEPGDTCLQAPVHLGVFDADWKRVKYYEWTKYGDLIFDDMHLHFVQNETPERRVVIWGDVPRYDVPWYVRIVVKFMHVILPPYVSGVQDAIHRNEKNLKLQLGIKNHFVHRYNGLFPSLSMSSFARICVFLSLVCTALKRAYSHTLWRSKRRELASMKEV